MALPKAKEDALSARLAGLPALSGKGWISAARAEALARLQAMGLPAKRDEYWRYTDPASLNSVDPQTTLARKAFASNGWRMPLQPISTGRRAFTGCLRLQGNPRCNARWRRSIRPMQRTGC